MAKNPTPNTSIQKKTNTGVLLESEIRSLKLIEIETPNPYADDECYKPASYDFRVGNEFFKPLWDHKDELSNDSFSKFSETNGLTFVEPYSSIVISTLENVKLPLNVVGRFNLRIQYALMGFVFQMGTQIEPGYYGKLFGLLTNFSDQRKLLKHGDRLLTAEFLYTSDEAVVSKEKRIKKDKLLEFISGDVVSGGLHYLLEEIQKARKDMGEIRKDVTTTKFNRYSIFIVLITIILSIILPLTVTKLTYDKDDYPLLNRSGLIENINDLVKERLNSNDKDDIENAVKNYIYQLYFDKLNEIDSIKKSGKFDPKKIVQMEDQINAYKEILRENH